LPQVLQSMTTAPVGGAPCLTPPGSGFWYSTHWLATSLAGVNTQLQDLCIGCDPLQEEITHVTGVSGKRIRAALLLCWYGIGSGRTAPLKVARLAAAAVELMHEASLIHDDVCDNSTQRRGRSSVAAHFGIRRAALTGAFLASRSVAELASICKNEGLGLDLASIRQLAEGQISESLTTRAPHLAGKSHYFGIVKSKTGSMFRLACELGSSLGNRYGGNVPKRKPQEFADSLAVAFQLLDDVLDIEADPGLLKPGRKDLAEGVPTWPILEWIASSPAPEAAWERVRQAHKEGAEIQQLYSDIVSSGSIQKARSLVRSQLGIARRVISTFPASEARQGLEELLTFLGSR